MTQIHRWFEGGRLLGVISLALILLAIGGLAVAPDPVEGSRLVIRMTARSSLLLFLAAFTASSFHRRWPGPVTRWAVRNRRSLGLGFAASHGIHAAAIIALARLDPALFGSLTNVGTIVAGGFGYAVIVVLAATSNDTAVARLGRPVWQRIHTIGVWLVWVSFVFTFGKRIPVSPLYALPVAMLAAAALFRLLNRSVRQGTNTVSRASGSVSG